jgi:hypothetical protein
MADNPFTSDQLDEPVQELMATIEAETLGRLCAYAPPAVVQELAERGPGIVQHVIELERRIRTLEAERADLKQHFGVSDPCTECDGTGTTIDEESYLVDCPVCSGPTERPDR